MSYAVVVEFVEYLRRDTVSLTFSLSICGEDSLAFGAKRAGDRLSVARRHRY